MTKGHAGLLTQHRSAKPNWLSWNLAPAGWKSIQCPADGTNWASTRGDAVRAAPKATLLLLEGLYPLLVSEMLGHTSVTFTLAAYGHILAEMRKTARDAMERLFGNAFADALES